MSLFTAQGATKFEMLLQLNPAQTDPPAREIHLKQKLCYNWKNTTFNMIELQKI